MFIAAGPVCLGLEERQMVELQNRVTPNLHSLALSLLPPTGHTISLIASSCCVALARDKWVFCSLACLCLHVCVCVHARCMCAVIHGKHWGRAPSLHHMVKVGI